MLEPYLSFSSFCVSFFTVFFPFLFDFLLSFLFLFLVVLFHLCFVSVRFACVIFISNLTNLFGLKGLVIIVVKIHYICKIFIVATLRRNKLVVVKQRNVFSGEKGKKCWRSCIWTAAKSVCSRLCPFLSR
jgi:hypothetical protein